jgi:hypothetical protein
MTLPLSYCSTLNSPLHRTSPKQLDKKKQVFWAFLIITLSRKYISEYFTRLNLLSIVHAIINHIWNQGIIIFFWDYTVQRRRPQHARTLTPMNTRTQTPPLWAPPKDWADRSWSSRSHGNVAYHLMHSTGKSWNKSRKCKHQRQVEDLNPGG